MERFLALGRLAVDFAHTGGEGWRSRWETWHRPRDLAEWLAWSSLGLQGVRVSERELVAAKEVRESLLAALEAAVDGRGLPRRAIAVVNAAASQPPLMSQLDSRGRGWSWRRPLTATAALSTVTRDAIDLLGAEDRDRLRRCANPRCRILFFDDSRPGSRRWCQPNRCGDRLRAQAYRDRQAGSFEAKRANKKGHK